MISGRMAMDVPLNRSVKRFRTLLAAGLLVFAVVVGTAVAYPSIGRWLSADVSIDASRIRVGTVTRGDLVRDIPVVGRVVAAFHPTLFSPSDGIVTIETRAGAVVEEGQVLGRIASPMLGNQLSQALSKSHALSAELERQRIRAEQVPLRNDKEIRLLQVRLDAARRARVRAEKSKALGVLTAVEYEKSQDDVEILTHRLEFVRENAILEERALAFEVAQCRSELKRQQLAVAELERQVAALTIRSQVSGRVSRLHVEDRAAVKENTPLFTVVDLSAFEIEISVPETLADDVGPGTTAVMSLNGRQYPGEVHSVSPEVDGSQVKGIVAFSGRPPDGLKQNQRISTRLVLESKSDVKKVPRGPFFEASGGGYAYVVEDGMAVQRPIKVGIVSVEEIEILYGLEPDERIIISDTAVFDGAKSVQLRQ